MSVLFNWNGAYSLPGRNMWQACGPSAGRKEADVKPRTGFRAMLVFAAFAVAIVGFVPSDSGAEEPPASGESGVAARIGSEVVTMDELDRAIDMTVNMMRARGAPEPQEGQVQTIRQNVLKQMVDGKVLSVLARDAGYEVDDNEVDSVLEQQKGGFSSEEEFVLALEGMGLTVDGLRERVREQTVIRKFVDSKVEELNVTDEEVQAEYDRLKAAGSMDTPESVDVAHILARVEGEEETDWNEAEQRIKAARQRIVDGEEFDAVMKEVSEDPGGGVYRNVQRGRMVPKFEEKMFSTAVDEISEPFRTRFGWHILTVLAKHESGTRPFAEVSERIEQTLKAGKTRDLVDKLIEDGKAGMNVEILVDAPDGTS